MSVVFNVHRTLFSAAGGRSPIVSSKTELASKGVIMAVIIGGLPPMMRAVCARHQA
jgi:hypothetical protein